MKVHVVVILYQGVVDTVEVHKDEKKAKEHFVKNTEGLKPNEAEDTDYDGSQLLETEVIE